jgi:uncharacterized protein (DUF2461 family)
MAGESLKRPPPGYDPAHPFIEDIKRKDFAISVTLKDSDLMGPNPSDAAFEGLRSSAPFVRFVTKAPALPF